MAADLGTHPPNRLAGSQEQLELDLAPLGLQNRLSGRASPASFNRRHYTVTEVLANLESNRPGMGP
eukprot:1596210-Pyramimonas_sp.AAC.1